MKKKVVVFARKSYGAFEMKEFIGKSTVRSFALTMALVALVPMVYIAVSASVTPPSIVVLPGVPTTTVILPQPEAQTPPPSPITKQIPPDVDGIPTKIDNNVEVPENVDVPEVVEIGQGDGINSPNNPNTPSNLSQNSGPETPATTMNQLPTDDEEVYTDVDQEPVLNYNQLRQNLQYPEIALRMGREGSVLLRVVVGIDGKPVVGKVRVVESSFSPAIQNNHPIEMAVMVPIRFYIR
ncbi:MAG: energy transducer TonB [Ignavibacteria bacterium]|nr:energy transducer TonB [Ignavibacteria bacterium]